MGVVTIRGSGVTLRSSFRVIQTADGGNRQVTAPLQASGSLQFTVSGVPDGAVLKRAYVNATTSITGRGTFTLAGRQGTVANLPISSGFPNGRSVSVNVGFAAKPTGSEEGEVSPGKLYEYSCQVTASVLVIEYDAGSSGGGGGGEGGDDLGQSGTLQPIKGPGRDGEGFFYYPEGTTDFSWNGLALRPIEALVQGEKNGDFSAQMDLQMTENGPWRMIAERGFLLMPAPVTPMENGVPVMDGPQEKMQVFRVSAIDTDDARGIVTITARHVFYDLQKAILVSDASNVKDMAANDVLAMLQTECDHPMPHRFFTDLDGKVTGDFRGMNVVEAILDPEDGIAVKLGAKIVRDNWDVYLLREPGMHRGIRIEHGRNCEGAHCTYSSAGRANRIVAVMDEKYSVHDDPNREADAEILTVFRKYDKKNGTAEEQARAEFENGLNGTDFEMDVDFVLLSESSLYPQYAGMQKMYLYDRMDLRLRQGSFTAEASGYTYNSIVRKYDSMTVGVTAVQRSAGSVSGYQIGGMQAGKLIGPVQGSQLADGSIDLIKASRAMVQELMAESLKTVTAEIIRLHAGEITTDALYAALAGIARAEIGTADIDFAQIKDLVTDTAIITQGVGGELYIAKLSVTDANLVSLTAGELIVKGKDGGFYALTVDDGGNIQTVRKQVDNGDIKNISINAGEKLIEGSVTAATLNVRDIFADSAIIRNLIAANLDVGTLFAREATLDQINAMDIMGNRYLSVAVNGLQEEIQAAAEESGQQMTISFDTGNAIEKERQSLTARIHVWKNGTDITDDIPLSAFTWTKDSDQETDTAWGTENAGKTAVILTRADIGKSCRISCTVDAGESYGKFEIIGGELYWTGTDEFSILDGNLYGDGVTYRLQDGTVYHQTAPGKMTVTSTAFDHSVLENSGLTITDDGVHLYTGGAFTVDSGNFSIDKNGNVTVKGTVTAEDGLIGGWKINPGSLSSGEGTKHVRLSTADETYGIWAGAEDAENAPFRVGRDGSTYLTKLYVTDENGVAQESPVNLNASYWQVNSAWRRAVRSMSVQNETLTITLNDGTTVNFKKAGFSALELRQEDPQGRSVFVYNPEAHTYNVQKTVYVYDNNEYIGMYSTINETSGTEAYEDGFDDVVISGIARQAADSFTGGDDHGTTVYIRATASNGKTGTQSFRVSGESAYALGESAGEAAGHEAGYAEGHRDGEQSVTLSSKGWASGGTNRVEASNGKIMNVTLPSFNVSGGDSFANNKTVVSFYADGITGNLKQKEVDASSVYANGQTAGANTLTIDPVEDVTLGYSESKTVTATTTDGDGGAIEKTVTITSPADRYGTGYNSGFADGKESYNPTSIVRTGYSLDDKTVTVKAANGHQDLLTGQVIDAQEIYTGGFLAGTNGVLLISSGWQGGRVTVTATNGQSVAVDLPSFSVSGGDTFADNKTTVYFSTPSVSGPLQSKEVDASSVYKNGWNDCVDGLSAIGNVYTISEHSGEMLYKKVGDAYTSVGSSWVKVSPVNYAYYKPSKKE